MVRRRCTPPRRLRRPLSGDFFLNSFSITIYRHVFVIPPYRPVTLFLIKYMYAVNRRFYFVTVYGKASLRSAGGAKPPSREIS